MGLASPGRSEITVKKSRFLGFAWPVDSAEHAETLVDELRHQHREARHVCYAYRAGVERENVRSSDDGEPSGTAGRPILEVLLQRDIRCAVVAVVRYFGGILLGAPGLVRAYSQAASLALDDARVALMVPHLQASVTVPYHLLGKFRHLLGEVQGREEDAQYGEEVTVTVLVPAPEWPSFCRQLDPYRADIRVKREAGVRYRAV